MAENETRDSPLSLPEELPPQPVEQVTSINGNDDNDQSMADAHNPKEDSDSDSDSDTESDSDDEAQLNLQIQTLEAELSNNPSNYDAHVQYIRALRKQGDVEKLRQAREAMSALFPLSPELWREWARDETTLSSGPEALPAIEQLCERGVLDYLSVDLWCDYINFVQDYDPLVRECSTNGISKARNLFERAVIAAGLHVAEGSRIYEAYREFEQAIALTIGETDIESREKQVQLIRNLFFRQLSVPLANLRSTLLTYKTWEAEQGSTLGVDPNSLDGLPSNVASAYQKALDLLNARTHFEEQIARKDIPDDERLQKFMTYLNFEQSMGDPARVQILYERAITDFPIYADLWLDYTRYLDKTIKTSSTVKAVYSRATRNCPWVGELWVRYLLHLERVHASEEELSTVFEKSLQCTFSSYDEYLDLFLTRVDGLRRRISSTSKTEDCLNYDLIRDVFKRASDYLSPHLKNTDSLLRMYSYWARLESKLGKDIVAARGVWENLLKISGSMLGAWEGYIAVEVAEGHINEARSLYKRCYTKKFSGTGSEDICHSWLCFEREHGSLEDFDIAVQKVTPRLEELQLFKTQQETKSAGSSDQRETMKKTPREKRKLHSDLTEDQSPAKRRKNMSQNLKMTNEKDRVEAAESVEKSKVEVISTKPESASKRETNDQSPRKPKHYNDQCTAFVSNIGVQATYEDLRAFFSDVGGVVAIRILTDKFTGKSRGLAYVDFSDDAHLAAALAKNKKNLLGKKVSIARSDPQHSKKKGTFGPKSTSKHGVGDNQSANAGQSDSKDSASRPKEHSGSQAQVNSQKSRDERVELKGKNTFAVPRAVRPLGWSSEKPGGTEGDGDEKPKSNDEFRKMFLKK
nr:squamous cell carcinoma antigen recognized by T-cells 3 [Coffea arabica]